MVRCFIAILVPENIKQKIFAIQKAIKELPLEAKFVEYENLHVSLSFLGEISEEKITEIEENLDTVCSKYGKFIVRINGVKLIPSENYIRVIALDVGQDFVEPLRKDIVSVAGGKSKSAHLTLCRVRKILNKSQFIKAVNSIKLDVENFEVDKIYLMKSTLQHGGPVYSVLHGSKLQ